MILPLHMLSKNQMQFSVPSEVKKLLFPILCMYFYILDTFLFVLRFYGPVNPMGSCRARSVYLNTRLLGKLSPLNG